MDNVTWLFPTLVYLQKLAWLSPQSLQVDNFPDLLERALSYSKYTGLDSYINKKEKNK